MAKNDQAQADGVAVAEAPEVRIPESGDRTQAPLTSEERDAQMGNYEDERNKFISSLTDNDFAEMEKGSPIPGSEGAENVDGFDDNSRRSDWGDEGDVDEGFDYPDDDEVGAEEEAEPEAEADADDEGEEEHEDGGRPRRMRMRPADARQAKMLEMMREHPDKNPIEIARFLGYEDPGTGESDEDGGDDGMPEGIKSVAEIKAEIKEVRAKLREAKREGDWDGEADLDEQIEGLQDQLEYHEAKAQYDASYDRAEAKAKADFPDFADPESEMSARMAEVDEAWREMGDRRYGDPQKPLVLAKLVAKEMGIRPGASKAEPKTTPPRKRSTRPAPLAPGSGSSRAQSSPGRSLVRRIGEINNVDELNELYEELGITRSL